MMHLKRNKMISNLKAQSVAISSVHLAELEIKNAKVLAIPLAVVEHFSYLLTSNKGSLFNIPSVNYLNIYVFCVI
jgi:hypothetical protein